MWSSRACTGRRTRRRRSHVEEQSGRTDPGTVLYLVMAAAGIVALVIWIGASVKLAAERA